MSPLLISPQGEKPILLRFKRNSRVPTQLSYSVNERLSGDAVHVGEAGLPAEVGIQGQKHLAIRLSVPQEMPNES